MDLNKKPTKRLLNDGDGDKPIPDAYKIIDNDLARDNLENNLPAAELQDL